VPAGGGNFDGAFDMLLTFDLAEIKIRFSSADPASGQPLIECTGSKAISPRKKCTTCESEQAP
jgi:hypothetical protein